MVPVLIRRILLLCVLGTGLAVAAHGVPAGEVVATIDNFTFSPDELHVPAGTTVTWTNRDDIPHTVTDADNPRTIKSGPLDTGESYRRTFSLPGKYSYFCSLHPHMQGKVVVE